MYLTGTDAGEAPKVALERLKAFLEGALNTPLYKARFKAAFSKFQLVHVATPDTPDTQIDKFFSVQPFLFLEISGDDQMVWKRKVAGTIERGTRHELEIMIDVVCSDACRPLEPFLKPALLEVIDAGFDSLNALCIEETEIKAGMGRYPLPNRINPHTLSCAVHALRIEDPA